MSQDSMFSVARSAVSAAAIFVLAAVVAVGESDVPLRALVGRTLTGQVTAVVDGDTIDVRLYSDRLVRVRLEGIDAPTMGAPFSGDARTIARNLLFERTVVLTVHRVEPDDQLVARVTANGRDASGDLVGRGVACVFHSHLTDVALASAQRQAQIARQGFWRFPHSRPAACPLIPPLSRAAS